MDRLGCGYADLATINPRLVYCALKGFLTGPYEHRPALDEVVQFMARARLHDRPARPAAARRRLGRRHHGRRLRASIAIQAALRERERTGRGQLVKIALFESTAFLMAQHMAGQAITGRAPPPMPARAAPGRSIRPFKTADGEQIFVGVTSDRNGARFCEHFGRADLLANPAYKTNEDRVRERPALLPVVAAIVGAAHAGRACRTVRSYRYSIRAGRQARRPVRRSAAQRRRPHARRRFSRRRARENSAPADRDRTGTISVSFASRRPLASTAPRLWPS